MAKRSLEIRAAEKEKQLEEALLKVQQYKNQLRDLNNRKSSEERKQRTHRLIVAGAELAALYEHVLGLEEVHMLIDFLRQEKDTGRFDVVKRENPIQETTGKIQEEKKEGENNPDYGGMFHF